MSEAVRGSDVPEIDYSRFVTEDDEPVDNQLSEKQMRLLTRPLYATWAGREFVAMANIALFYGEDEDPIVPDVLLSLGVRQPADLTEKKNRSYFVWRYGKPPDVVIEIVSNDRGGEDTRKLETYARVRVSYYVIYDPLRILSQRPLKAYRLVEGRYVDLLDPGWLPEVGLGLVLWEGEFEGLKAGWVRWCDENRAVLPTGQERAEQERERADRLAQKLRELGIDPDAQA
ncbi:MAG: Uma2 family endonuclease [Armatimonadetes bacterium]|nr:Uma2 family endonuclease [Armatimonadota bacterium]